MQSPPPCLCSERSLNRAGGHHIGSLPACSYRRRSRPAGNELLPAARQTTHHRSPELAESACSGAPPEATHRRRRQEQASQSPPWSRALLTDARGALVVALTRAPSSTAKPQITIRCERSPSQSGGSLGRRLIVERDLKG